MTDDKIHNLEELENCIGKMSPSMTMKVIDHLDEGALKWVAACSLYFMGFSSKSAPIPTIAGGKPGFIKATHDTIEIPLTSLDHVSSIDKDAGFGSLSILPQTGEMMRINGKVADITDEAIKIVVSECYIHCAKALIRSDFWASDHSLKTDIPEQMDIGSTSFLALYTMDEKGNVDVSPKGDPSGLLLRSDGQTLWIPERPGNRRADSFKNILTQPHIAAHLIHPGSKSVYVVQGKAEITTHSIRHEFAIDNRIPALVTRIIDTDIQTIDSLAIDRSLIWERKAPGIKPAKILSQHFKMNKEIGRASKLLLSLPGFMRRELDAAYKKGLY